MSRRAMIAVAWTIVVLILCWMPRDSMSKPEGSYVIPHLDKAVHAGMFGMFGALWTWAGRGRRPAGLVFLCGLALAIVTELGQGISLVNRDPDMLDALADLVGTAVGIAFGLWCDRRFAGRLSKPLTLASSEVVGR